MGKTPEKINFNLLQQIEKQSLEKDRAINSVEAEGITLEAAIADAAILLDVSARHVDYEVIQRGFPGFIGMGKNNWRIKASLKPGAERKHAVVAHAEEQVEAAPVIVDKDGEAFVLRSTSGKVMLKVTAPVGKGAKVKEESARQALIDSSATDIDRKMVMAIVREAEGKYIPVADFDHHSYNDSVVRTEISSDEMKASMKVSPPGEGGAALSFDEYMAIFKQNNIMAGVKEDYLVDFIDRPEYDQEVEIAVGSEPVKGRDAYIKYYFETDQNKMKFKEGAGGKIDFKELNIIQNVSANQEIAKKIPPEKGVNGKTVTGKLTFSTDGEDIPLPLGTNTRAGDDGETIFATIDGQVIVVGNVVNVEPVLTIEGDVNLKTGNIDFKGTVVVKGSIDDGFTVKATGNIEVNGNVGKANLDSAGDVVIHQGVNGKGGGFIKAGKSMWAKFIENANIETGNLVIVSDGIINSQVSANSRILVQGKRASIMGGRLRASEEINAKVLGSANTGMATIFEVGYDPKKKAELDHLMETKAKNEKQIETNKTTIQSLQNIKKQRGSLPKEKEEQLAQLITEQDNLAAELEKIKTGIQSTQEFLDKLKGRGKISASDAVHAGVKIAIRDQVNDVYTTQKNVTFAMDESGNIKAGKYEAPDESLAGALEGFSTPGPSASGGGSLGDYKRMEHELGDTADGISRRARGIKSEEGEKKEEKKGGLFGLFKKKEKEEGSDDKGGKDPKDPLNVFKLIDEKKTGIKE
jgi:uncharacterized protein (DUF342 family)